MPTLQQGEGSQGGEQEQRVAVAAAVEEQAVGVDEQDGHGDDRGAGLDPGAHPVGEEHDDPGRTDQGQQPGGGGRVSAEELTEPVDQERVRGKEGDRGLLARV